MTNRNIVKIGRVELWEDEAMKIVGRYIVAFRTVYSVKYSQNAGVYGVKIYYSENVLPLTKRGRYIVVDAPWINKLVGFNLLQEEGITKS